MGEGAGYVMEELVRIWGVDGRMRLRRIEGDRM